MTEPWSITRLDEVEALPAEHGLQVRLLRRALGIESFGINAYLAAAVGDVVIEEHDELGRGAGRHEELYVVLRGRASFTVAGEQVDAPTGTLVVVRDPATRRGAIAADADTAVLVVAGVPGQPYRPSAWEHWFAATGPNGRGDHAAAVAIIREGLEAYPDNAQMLFNAACYEALAGDRAAATGHLAEALAIDPSLDEWARDDPDLQSLREY